MLPKEVAELFAGIVPPGWSEVSKPLPSALAPRTRSGVGEGTSGLAVDLLDGAARVLLVLAFAFSYGMGAFTDAVVSAGCYGRSLPSRIP